MSLPTLLTSLERLVLDIALWVMLVPKTLAHIVRHPRAIVLLAGTAETEPEPEPQNEYVSLVLLWLIVGVLPGVPVIASKWGPGWIAHPLLVELGVESKVAAAAALLMLGPLAFAAAHTLVARKRLGRDTLRIPFVIQCGCFAPFLLAYFAGVFAWLQAKITVHESAYGAMAVGAWVAGAGWFIIAEFVTLRMQLSGNRLRSITAFAFGLLLWAALVLASRLLLLVMSAYFA